MTLVLRGFYVLDCRKEKTFVWRASGASSPTICHYEFAIFCSTPSTCHSTTSGCRPTASICGTCCTRYYSPSFNVRIWCYSRSVTVIADVQRMAGKSHQHIENYCELLQKPGRQEATLLQRFASNSISIPAVIKEQLIADNQRIVYFIAIYQG